MRCLIVDDEHLARKLIENYLNKIPDMELVAQAKNAKEAWSRIADNQIDLMFLDIQMPDLTGLELMRSLTEPPAVIFTTAYADYALQGFELDAVDYLVKPFSFERFVQGVKKARARMNPEGKASVQKDHFFVKADYKWVKVMFDQVLYIEGMREYVAIHLPDKRLIVYQSMKKLAEMLEPREFLRTHKSYIISMQHVSAVYGNTVQIGDKELPIGKSYKEAFMQKLETL